MCTETLISVYRRSRDAPENDQGMVERLPRARKLTDHYLALLVAILTNAGLCEVRLSIKHCFFCFSSHVTQALISMLEETTTGTNLSRKATLLMAEILSMANRVLPLSLAAQIQVSPLLVTMSQFQILLP